MNGVMFFLALLGGAEPEPAVRIDSGSDPARVRVEAVVSADLLKGLPIGPLTSTQGEARLSFHLLDADSGRPGPPILGTYERTADKLIFTPRHPLASGQRYRVILDLGGKQKTVEYGVAAKKSAVPAVVNAVFPTSSELPANQLKFYLHFSRPMRESRTIFEHLHILDEKGKPIPDPWRRTELWSSDGKRLTLWIHPGRIKEGVKLRDELGPVLVPERSYSLVIGKGLLDEEGQPLAEEFRKKFRTTKPVRTLVDVGDWKVQSPKAGTRQPLVLEFPQPLDHALLPRFITILDDNKQVVKGQIVVGKEWDVKDETGLRYAKGVLNVEYHRDIRPIFERSCVACHSSKSAKPAGNLVLDDDKLVVDFGSPGTYRNLVYPKNSKSTPYLWPSQARNSLLTWKVFGRRTDGFPEKMVPGAAGDHQGLLNRGGLPYSPFKGSIMPPPEAVAGTYDGPDGTKIKVAPLTDEDRRTLVRWIDLGCPLDRAFDPKQPERQGNGWMLDDQRPTLTLTYPQAGVNDSLKRILVGMYDYSTGLDLDKFEVIADFPVDGTPAGENLAQKFKVLPDSRWELQLTKPITELPKGKLTVSIKDGQGNMTRIDRTFSVASPAK